MKNSLRIANLLSLLFLLLLLTACGDKKVQKKQPPVPGVLVQKVAFKEIKEHSFFVGRTYAINDVSLKVQVKGYLLDILFTEGTNINRGDELFIIDPDIYKASVAAAEGTLAKAKADKVRAEKDLARYKKLLITKNISQQQVDDTVNDVLQTEAQVKIAAAELQKSQLDLSYTIIKSPINGRIGQALVSVGNLVEPQTKSLARIVELDPMYVNFSISEGDLISFKRKNRITNVQKLESLKELKLEVKLILPDGSEYKNTGYIDFIDNAVDAYTGSILVRARFANPDSLLVPGLFVRTKISKSKKIPKLLIHASAIQEDQAGKFVLIVDADNKISRRQITTGKQYAGDIVVNSGLDPDTLVLVEGIQKVRLGMLVKPRIAVLPGDENTIDNKNANSNSSPGSDNKEN